VGRFAPSPTGQLHLGTLAAAVASYLHARQSNGEWLVRIEDIDPPREIPGSAASILHTLEAMELGWDREVRYQSQHIPKYLATADSLFARKVAYYCCCSRRQLRAMSSDEAYPGTCRERDLPADDAALRLRADEAPIEFNDGLMGAIRCDIQANDGDFVIVRRDGLPAYHLAVVMDDADQGVTDVVRGADLLASTPLHICLQRRLGLATPRYWHIPLITTAAGEKLSKRSGSAPVDNRQPAATASRALSMLGLDPPAELRGAQPRELWLWAQSQWQIDTLAGHSGAIALPE
jgi:glutamyl-Q tRNA(Asp) synthetase